MTHALGRQAPADGQFKSHHPLVAMIAAWMGGCLLLALVWVFALRYSIHGTKFIDSGNL